MPALLAGLAFLILGLACLPQAYDGSAFTYFIAGWARPSSPRAGSGTCP